MAMKEAAAQRKIFRGPVRDLTATVDWSKVTTTKDGVKYLPAGTPLASTEATPAYGDVLLDRSLKMKPLNADGVTGILKHDAYEDMHKAVTFVYGGEAIIEEVNSACQTVFTADIEEAAKTALKRIEFVSAGHRQS